MSTASRSRTAKVQLPYDEIADFCRRWNIVRLELFGSALRDDFGPDSDLDFLYVFAPESHIGWRFVDLCEELERLVGRPVDMVSRKAIEASTNPRRKQEILETAQVIYAA
jgi:predicted nucleotidyltransferase